MKIIISLLVFISFSFAALAQNPEITPIDAPMSLGNRPGYSMKILNISEKQTISLWEDFTKDEFGSKAKSVKGADELMAEGAKNKNISSEDFTIYFATKASGKDVVVTVWFDLGSGFLNPEMSSAKNEIAKTKLADFNYAVQRELAKEEIEKEEDKLKDAEKVLSRLVDNSESIQDDIRNYEDKIDKSKRELEKNKTEQDVAKSALDVQTKTLEDAKKALDKIGK
ncbi:MAG: hypothetical protein WED33_02930 [Bacteroidia bacterium]